MSIVGGDDLVSLHSEVYSDAFIAVGSIADVFLRKKLYHKLKTIGFHIPNIIDKSSNVSSFSTLGEGVFIGKNVVNANTELVSLDYKGSSMLQTIKDIFFRNIDMLSYSDKAITYVRVQNYSRLFSCFTKLIDTAMMNINDILINKEYFNKSTVLIDINYVDTMLKNLLKAHENKDYILLADLLEMQMKPFLFSLQEFIVSEEGLVFDEEKYINNIEIIQSINSKLGMELKKANHPLKLLEAGVYTIEPTSCGLLTLAINCRGEKSYLHSNGDILREAFMLARDWFHNDKSEYIVYGLGLGYHVNELMNLDNNIEIKVFESDLHIIQLACAFTDISKLLITNRVSIYYDPDLSQLGSHIRKMDTGLSFDIHYPSLRNINNNTMKEQLEDFFVSNSSISNQIHNLNFNFKKNILLKSEYIDNLKEDFYNKDLYIVAAGPSLDKNFMQLKNLGDNAIILVTGTVYKKLLNAGINPDYVIIIDANEEVYPQIIGVEESNIPLLYLSTVYHKITENYQGKKYLICQEGFQRAEKYAKLYNYDLYQSGGSVSTTALDIGIRFKCKRIIFIGLDLAFTNNYDHASETQTVNNVSSTDDLRQVKDIYGNLICTSKNLDIYRKWIERRIEGVKNIEFIDATEGGALIKGMKIKKLLKVL